MEKELACWMEKRDLGKTCDELNSEEAAKTERAKML
jgi:hypothetical protein